MFTDKAIFSNAQAITASGNTTSTNYVDTEVAASNIGGGTPLWLVCRVNTTFTDATSGALTVTLNTCATSNGTYVVLATGRVYSVGVLVKGLDVLTIPLPADNLRYLGLTYANTVGSGFTAGKLDAFLCSQPPLN